MVNLRDNYWAVEVPEGAINIIIDMGYIIWKEPNYKNWCTNDILADYGKLHKYLETHKAEDDYKTGGMPLPPGTWQIVCTSKKVTEEQAASIVERDKRGFKHYWKDKGFTPRGFNARYDKSTDSLASLLASKGCDLNKTYLIIKNTL